MAHAANINKKKAYGKQFETVLRNKMKYISVKQPDSKYRPHSVYLLWLHVLYLKGQGCLQDT